MRENGLSPTFSGLWMGKCFELHTLSEVFCQQGLLLPTLERLNVNVRSSIYLWTSLLPFGSHLLIAGAVSLHCYFKSIQTHNVTGMEMYILGLYSYLFCPQLARMHEESLWNSEIF